MGLFLHRCKTWRFTLLNLMKVRVSTFLQPVEVPLDVIEVEDEK